MVLADLGAKITSAINNMASAVVIDDKAVEVMTGAIALALLQGDVDVHLVKKMKENIKNKCSSEELTAGMNKRRQIEGVVIKELYNLLDPGVEPYKLKKRQVQCDYVCWSTGLRQDDYMYKICILLSKKRLENVFGVCGHFSSGCLRPAQTKRCKSKDTLLW